MNIQLLFAGVIALSAIPHIRLLLSRPVTTDAPLGTDGPNATNNTKSIRMNSDRDLGLQYAAIWLQEWYESMSRRFSFSHRYLRRFRSVARRREARSHEIEVQASVFIEGLDAQGEINRRRAESRAFPYYDFFDAGEENLAYDMMKDYTKFAVAYVDKRKALIREMQARGEALRS